MINASNSGEVGYRLPTHNVGLNTLTSDIMMFSRALVLAVSAMPLLAAATPANIEARTNGGGGDSCNTGPVQCCNSTATAGSAAGSAILGLLGIVVQDLNLLLGLNCSPITVIGGGVGGDCSAQTVCCQDNSHGSLISIGCIPITL
ncbi:fungal hydrophobin-domain-containing protein [Fomes fomentarius]|nr:fungal hydrophobin-domain-containing protein [Fomes fomentarius]